MNRCALYIDSPGGEWQPGLPPPGTLCDIRPIALRDEAWGHLLVLGPIVGDDEGRVAVRVPANAKAREAGFATVCVGFVPAKCEWRVLSVPDFPEVSHA